MSNTFKSKKQWLLFFFIWDGVGTKDRFFHRGWGDGGGGGALIAKNTWV